jgi:hypothetical protein
MIIGYLLILAGVAGKEFRRWGLAKIAREETNNQGKDQSLNRHEEI